MEKTSIHFNEKGLVTGKTVVSQKENMNFDKRKQETEHIQEVLRKEKGDIPFEPPRDFDEEEESQVKSKISFVPPYFNKDKEKSAKGNINFEPPVEPSIEERLETLERGQNHITQMLQVLLENIPVSKYVE